MGKPNLDILNISDIHLGHPNNKTSWIINHLDLYFIEHKDIIKNVDIIIISGDTFDRLLPNNSRELVAINSWLARLAKFCISYNIYLMFLEGTPSHDYKQLRNFDSVINTLDLKDLKYKYAEDLEIVYFKEFDRTIMFLPDEYRDNAVDTFIEVKNKLKEHNLDKVDIIVMHGAFKYQIPQYDSDHFHIESDYLSIVNEVIIVGHVHFFSQFEKILVPGSFDALTHSDDDLTKGGLYISLRGGKFTYKFLINSKVTKFTTIDISDISLDIVDNKLRRYAVSKNPIFVRLLTKEEDDKIIFTFNSFREKYPNLILTQLAKKKKKEEVAKREVVKREFKSIDQTAIEKYIVEELKNDNRLTNEDKALVLEELNLLF